jgi:hypothetical protein
MKSHRTASFNVMAHPKSFCPPPPLPRSTIEVMGKLVIMHESSGPIWRSQIMAKKKLRLLKRVPPMIGICEGCLSQFKSIFTAAVAAEAEIRVRFATHKCASTDRNNAVRMRNIA